MWRHLVSPPQSFTARRPVLVNLKGQFDADAAHLRSKASRGKITPALATEMKTTSTRLTTMPSAGKLKRRKSSGKTPRKTSRKKSELDSTLGQVSDESVA